jgi:hypothetical protein
MGTTSTLIHIIAEADSGGSWCRRLMWPCPPAFATGALDRSVLQPPGPNRRPRPGTHRPHHTNPSM